MKRTITYITLCLLTLSCAKWNATEPVPEGTIPPWESNPELWEEYKADIRDYKSREHTIVYARFENSPENPVSEKGSMRSLPDSLDIVSLTNADNFSQADAEDMEWMKSVGTKVLYQVDFAGRAEELSSESALAAYLDKVIASVRENGLDGYSMTGIPKSGDPQREAMSRKMVATLSKAKTAGQLLAFEGNPEFIAPEDLKEIDLFVLATEDIERPYDLNNTIIDAKEYGVPEKQLLIAVKFDGLWYNEDNVTLPVVPAMAENVRRYGPMAGLAMYNIESDYFHTETNWITVRSAIENLNPSK